MPSLLKSPLTTGCGCRSCRITHRRVESAVHLPQNDRYCVVALVCGNKVEDAIAIEVAGSNRKRTRTNGYIHSAEDVVLAVTRGDRKQKRNDQCNKPTVANGNYPFVLTSIRKAIRSYCFFKRAGQELWERTAVILPTIKKLQTALRQKRAASGEC